jgi:hypothetical protein
MTKSYGMFTNTGNAMIEGVIMTAKAANMDAQTVVNLLWEISNINGYGEASDTEVREIVLSHLELI